MQCAERWRRPAEAYELRIMRKSVDGTNLTMEKVVPVRREADSAATKEIILDALLVVAEVLASVLKGSERGRCSLRRRTRPQMVLWMVR